MNWLTLCFALALAALFPGTSHALGTGNDLLRECKAAETLVDERSTNDEAGAFTCLGYLQGMRDGIDLTNGVSGGLKLICIPGNVQLQQLVRVVINWGNDNPEKLHEVQGLIVGMALYSAFPCPES